MKLPPAPERYDSREQNAMRAILEREDLNNLKRNQDVEIRTRLILASADGTRFQVTVSNAGAIVVAAV
jgi:hypothetical protein